jgi:hypothetical protein
MEYHLSTHAQSRLDGGLSKYVSAEEVVQEILAKKRHSSKGSHWVLIKELPVIYRVSRDDGASMGDCIVAIVRGRTVVTVMMREKGERLPSNCAYFWS